MEVDSRDEDFFLSNILQIPAAQSSGAAQVASAAQGSVNCPRHSYLITATSQRAGLCPSCPEWLSYFLPACKRVQFYALEELRSFFASCHSCLVPS